MTLNEFVQLDYSDCVIRVWDDFPEGDSNAAELILTFDSCYKPERILLPELANANVRAFYVKDMNVLDVVIELEER